MVDEIARVIPPHQARVNITYKRQHGELPDPVTFDSTDGDVRGWVAEAIRTGGVPGINADPDVRLTDYVIDRFPPVPGVRDYNLLDVRPKVEFG
jgi:hypothetical protein